MCFHATLKTNLGGGFMTFEITASERELLLEILESVSKETIHGIHHTDTKDYKEMLKQRLETIDNLKMKLESASE
jgi:metal-dependent hydrolase (beta-lactamase superfamily II)